MGKEALAYTRWLDVASAELSSVVGEKLFSLCRLHNMAEDFRVPNAFALTVKGFDRYLESNRLRQPLSQILDDWSKGKLTDEAAATSASELIHQGELPEDLRREILQNWNELDSRVDGKLSVTVRSSAVTADTLPGAFADQHISVLNLKSSASVIESLTSIYASLYSKRSLSYAKENDLDIQEAKMAIGVQELEAAEGCRSGILLTFDPQSQTEDMLTIQAVPGLGVSLNSGVITPDQYEVFLPVRGLVEKIRGEWPWQKLPKLRGEGLKEERIAGHREKPCILSPQEAMRLAAVGFRLRGEFGKRIELEWSLALDGTLSILQARSHQESDERPTFRRYTIINAPEPLAEGRACGRGVATGEVVLADSPDNVRTPDGSMVLVTERCDPDWVETLGKTQALVTDKGGATSHASMFSRELGIPAALGVGHATRSLKDGQIVTVSCADGQTAYIYDGEVEYQLEEVSIPDAPDLPVQIKINVADPRSAFQWRKLPIDGIGLARLEWVISREIGVHPLACLLPNRLSNDLRKQVYHRARYHDSPRDYYLQTLTLKLCRLAASQYPRPVLVRTSDFKTNEYAELLAGNVFEPKEANPMLGWRGAARYVDQSFQPAFELECEALRRTRDDMGFTNLAVMIPFCRTLGEADQVLKIMAGMGLARGLNGLEIHVMAEIPSNVLLAGEFAARFDGFSIGTNDLTQLVLGVDRDSEALSHLFDASDPAVRKMIEQLIVEAHEQGATVGLCGNAPSQPGQEEFCKFLVETGIDSISVQPDAVFALWRALAPDGDTVQEPS